MSDDKISRLMHAYELQRQRKLDDFFARIEAKQ